MGEYICEGTLTDQSTFTATATLLVGGTSRHIIMRGNRLGYYH